MKTMAVRSIAAFLALICVAASASELQTYVQQCENELHFNASDVPALDCNDGVPFAGPLAGESSGIVNDFFIHKRINNDVDLTVACRWLDNISGGRSTAAASVEMIIHNRSNAETCFFSAKDTGVDPQPVTNPLITRPVSTAIVSPTNFTIKKGSRNADAYWVRPTDLNDKTLPYGNTNIDHSQITYDSARCVGCHVAGPYIASSRIAPVLAQFGLLNDRHDTFADMSNTSKHYHAVGSVGTPPYDKLPLMAAFGSWDSFIAKYNVPQQSECSRSCHSIADNSPIHTLTSAQLDATASLLPSIQSDIAAIRASDPQIMPPYVNPYSDYRWINRDTPDGSGDWETLNDLQTEYPLLACDNATELQARVVGNRDFFSSADAFPDKLRTFNLKEGLECRNDDQIDGQCNDYKLRYMCNGTWTDWINSDSPTKDGDFERRTDPGYKNLCSSPTEMQAQTTVVYKIPAPIRYTLTFTAPNDRLFEFDPQHGLGCQKSDQPDGQCSNYVVRLICPN